MFKISHTLVISTIVAVIAGGSGAAAAHHFTAAAAEKLCHDRAKAQADAAWQKFIGPEHDYRTNGGATTDALTMPW